MAEVTYRLHDGTGRVVQIPDGTSVMQAAISTGVPGIVAECGGQMMCATCHVYVDTVDGAFPEQRADERDMLELAASPVNERSRLSCQLVVDSDLVRASVTVPEHQV